MTQRINQNNQNKWVNSGIDTLRSTPNPNTKGKPDTFNQAVTKWTDGKQSWQLFPKKVATPSP